MATIAGEQARDFRSIWDIALDIEKAKENTTNEVSDDSSIFTRFAGTESTVVFLGSKNSGKTSLILRVLERDETPKPTVALEYTFGRRTRPQSLVKDIGHLWELGGGTTMLKLLDIPISPENVLQNTAVVLVDLSRLDQMWQTLEEVLRLTKERVNECVKVAASESPTAKEHVKNVRSRLKEHTDGYLLEANALPIPLVIIGGKYDIFQDYDSEQKKLVCKTLRFLAHLYGANLQFYSSRQESLLLKTKALISSFLFKTQASKQLVTDYNKPLSIPAGLDSFEQIGMPPVKESDMAALGAKNPLDLWKHVYCTNFPQQDKNPWDTYMVHDPAKDKNFLELDVDKMRAKKDDELERYRRLCVHKAKEEQEVSAGRRGSTS